MATKTYRGPFGLLSVDVDTEKQAERRAAIGGALRTGAGAALVDAGMRLQAGPDDLVVEAVDTGRRYASGGGMGTGAKLLGALLVGFVLYKATR